MRPRLPHIAGLDGIRAVAVAVVVLYHLGISWMPAGFLGVAVFFVVSGYLITCLLLAEHETNGTVSLKRFWARRARRLLPALFLTLVAVTAFVAAVFRDELSDLWDQLVAAVLYVTNWLLIFQDQSYFETFGRPEALQHLWSLAIEEQFYLLWPLLFVGAMRWLGSRWFAVLIAIGVGLSTALMWQLYEPLEDPSRIYYGTDTRAAGLLLGALLAFVWRPWIGTAQSQEIPGQQSLEGDQVAGTGQSGRRNSWMLEDGSPKRWLVWAANILGPLALAGVVGWCWYLDEFDRRLYQGGFLLLGLTTAIVIVAVTVPNSYFAKFMDLAPLRWLGVRSYAIYLWHWPVFVFTRPRFDVTIDGWQLHLLRIAATLVLSDLSYRFVENPIRKREFISNLKSWAKSTRHSLRGYLVPLGAATALALTVAAMVVPQVPRQETAAVDQETLILSVSEEDLQLLRGETLPSAESGSGDRVSETGTPNASSTDTNTPDSSTPEASTNDPETTPPPSNPPDANNPEATNPEANSEPAPPEPSTPDVAPPEEPSELEGEPQTEPQTTPDDQQTTPRTPSPTAISEDDVFLATLPTGLPDPRPFAPTPVDWGDSEPFITAIGDSVMLGTRGFLEAAFGDQIHIDAEVSRQFSQLPQLIADYKQDPLNLPLGDVVIIHLGTNGFLNSRVFNETMAELADIPRVLFVNVRVPRTWEAEVNRQLANGIDRYENAYLVDWHGYSEGYDGEWLRESDGVHMNRDGAIAYTRLLQRSI